MKAIGKEKVLLSSRIKLLWFSPILIIAVIVKFPDWRRSWLLSNYGQETTATIELCTTGGLRNEFDEMNVLFSFSYKGKQYHGFESCEVNQRYVFNPMGLPIEQGQNYIVLFYPDDPGINRILLDKPMAVNMGSYLFDVADILGQTDEFKSLPPLKRLCLAISIFKNFHFDGWANIMFHDEYLFENFSNNGFTYRKMIGSEEFKTKTKNCDLLQ